MGLRRNATSEISSWKWEEKFPYLYANVYHFVYYINILLARRSWLNLRFKKRTYCQRVTCRHSIGYLEHVKNCYNFSHVVMRSFSVVEIPIKHSSFCNKVLLIWNKIMTLWVLKTLYTALPLTSTTPFHDYNNHLPWHKISNTHSLLMPSLAPQTVDKMVIYSTVCRFNFHVPWSKFFSVLVSAQFCD